MDGWMDVETGRSIYGWMGEVSVRGERVESSSGYRTGNLGILH